MRKRTWMVLGFAATLLAGALTVPAPEVGASEPCCSVTAIDAKTGLVTAQETATSKTFDFRVKDKALLKTLKVGAQESADFGTQKVTIHSATPCCVIVGPLRAAPVAPVR